MGNASNVIGVAPAGMTDGGHGGWAPDGMCWLVDGHWSTNG